MHSPNRRRQPARSSRSPPPPPVRQRMPRGQREVFTLPRVLQPHAEHEAEPVENVERALRDLNPLLRALVGNVASATDNELASWTGLTLATVRKRRSRWAGALTFLTPYLSRKVLSNYGVEVAGSPTDRALL